MDGATPHPKSVIATQHLWAMGAKNVNAQSVSMVLNV